LIYQPKSKDMLLEVVYRHCFQMGTLWNPEMGIALKKIKLGGHYTEALAL
jgi:hypothetical protein